MGVATPALPLNAPGLLSILAFVYYPLRYKSLRADRYIRDKLSVAGRNGRLLRAHGNLHIFPLRFMAMERNVLRAQKGVRGNATASAAFVDLPSITSIKKRG